MSAAVKTATPLPTGQVDSNDLLGLTLPALQILVTRSDAYPLLVGALRNMTHGFRATGGVSGSAEYAAFIGAERLLRELGEDV